MQELNCLGQYFKCNTDQFEEENERKKIEKKIFFMLFSREERERKEK